MTTTEPTSVHVFMNYYHAICKFQNTAAGKLDEWDRKPSSVSFQWERSLMEAIKTSCLANVGISGFSAMLAVPLLFTATVMIIKECRKIITIPLVFLGVGFVIFCYITGKSAAAETKIVHVMQDYLAFIKSPTLSTMKNIKESIQNLAFTDRCFTYEISGSPFCKFIYTNGYCQNLWRKCDEAQKLYKLEFYDLMYAPDSTDEEKRTAVKNLTVAFGKVVVELYMEKSKTGTKTEDFNKRLLILRSSDDNTYIHFAQGILEDKILNPYDDLGNIEKDLESKLSIEGKAVRNLLEKSYKILSVAREQLPASA